MTLPDLAGYVNSQAEKRIHHRLVNILQVHFTVTHVIANSGSVRVEQQILQQILNKDKHADDRAIYRTNYCVFDLR
jgi:hypothetical protein